MIEQIFRIEAPHFTAGGAYITIHPNGAMKPLTRVSVAADIIHYMLEWEPWKVKAYCSKRGWKYEEMVRP